MTDKNDSKVKNSQAKRWVFTLNNPKESKVQWNASTMEFLVYGEEVGESGTEHHQGFVIFKTNRRRSSLKEVNDRCFWEVARGTNQQASDYCRKDGKFHEYGIMPLDPIQIAQPLGAKANSEKWREINDKAKEGDLNWIDEKYPKVWNNSYRNLKTIKTDFMKRQPDLNDVCGIWYHGDAGVGKTRLVTQKYPNAYLKRMNKWFDGYQNEEVIVLDDLGKDHSFMGYELKKLADRYCYMVEIKNDSRYIRPKQVVVTSQFKIERIWEFEKETKDALLRRFKQIEVTKDNLAMLLKVETVEEINSTPEVIYDDDEADAFDQLMIETDESLAQAKKREHKRTVFDKIVEANKKKAMKRKVMFTPRYAKQTSSRNQYFQDKYRKIDFKPRVEEIEEISDEEEEEAELPLSQARYQELICDEEVDDESDNPPSLYDSYDIKEESSYSSSN